MKFKSQAHADIAGTTAWIGVVLLLFFGFVWFVLDHPPGFTIGDLFVSAAYAVNPGHEPGARGGGGFRGNFSPDHMETGNMNFGQPQPGDGGFGGTADPSANNGANDHGRGQGGEAGSNAPGDPAGDHGDGRYAAY